MTNPMGATRLQVTMLPSFSLYVSAKLRAGGLDKPVLFDATGYAGVELPVERWVTAQRRASADRLLLPRWPRVGVNVVRLECLRRESSFVDAVVEHLPASGMPEDALAGHDVVE